MNVDISYFWLLKNIQLILAEIKTERNEKEEVILE